MVGNMLDKRGAIYSDRPYNRVAMNITEGNHFSFEQHGPSWKMKRTIAVRFLSPQKLDTHHFRIQEAESVIFLNNLADDPENIFDYARLYPVSVACALLYGHRAKDLNSFWFKEFYHMMEMVRTFGINSFFYDANPSFCSGVKCLSLVLTLLLSKCHFSGTFLVNGKSACS